LKVSAVTFDDFYTLRYPVEEKEDIIYPILKVLKKRGLNVNDENFLNQYFRADRLYRKKLEETMRESLLDNIVMEVLILCGYKPKNASRIVKEAVDYGIATRKARWFPDTKRTLITLREKGYKLGLISNTHWRISEGLRKEFKKFFDIITLSYEHGYAKPHPSIFITTSKKLKVKLNQCLHVGDDPILDIQGAKKVGMKTAFVRRIKIKTDADIEIKQLIELTKLL
jgi:HAD superfamily hydrolase (TIGR01549 family)